MEPVSTLPEHTSTCMLFANAFIVITRMDGTRSLHHTPRYLGDPSPMICHFSAELKPYMIERLSEAAAYAVLQERLRHDAKCLSSNTRVAMRRYAQNLKFIWRDAE
jgi:hypothetical protein